MAAMTRSTPAGAALVALCIVMSALTAIWISGFVRIFAENRGLLQLLVAIPTASLATASALSFRGTFTPAQMLWGMVPVEVLILLGAGVLVPDVRVWPWVLAVSAVVFIPWIAGVRAGLAMRGTDPAD